MTRLALPSLGAVAILWAIYAIVQMYPARAATAPPVAPPVSEFAATVAAVGLVEPSSENISVGSPLAAVVTRVFVTAGDVVERGDPLFSLDVRTLNADLAVRTETLRVAAARAGVVGARLADLQRQLAFAEQITDTRAISTEELARRRSAVETAIAELQEARAAIGAAEAHVSAVRVELARSVVRAPLQAEVLQVRLRVGEFAPAAATANPLIVLGRGKPLHVRVDVDEQEAWRCGATPMRVGASVAAPTRGFRWSSSGSNRSSCRSDR